MPPTTQSSSNKPRLKDADRRCSARPHQPTTSWRNDKINLERITSAQFDELLGEGASTDVISNKKLLQEGKKSADVVRRKVLTSLNQEVVRQKNINEGSSSDEEMPLHLLRNPSKQNMANTRENTEKNSSSDIPKDKPDIPELLNDKPEDQSKTIKNKEDGVNPDHQLSRAESDVMNKSKSGEVKNQKSGDELEIHANDINNNSAQTEPTTVFCGCLRCKDLLERFYLLVNDTLKYPCKGSPEASQVAFHQGLGWPSPSGPSGPTGPTDSLHKSDQMVPLLQGCKVLIPITKKNNIKHKVKSGDPQDYVNVLMDIFFKPEEMANMTAAGRTAGSIKINEDIKEAIMAYVSHKYDKQKFNFDHTLFTSFINNKCYCERRKLWAKEKKDTDETIPIRKKLEKRKKKIGEENNGQGTDENQPNTSTSLNSSSKPKPKPSRVPLKVSKLRRSTASPRKGNHHRPSAFSHYSPEKSRFIRKHPPTPRKHNSVKYTVTPTKGINHDDPVASSTPNIRSTSSRAGAETLRPTTGGKRPKSIYLQLSDKSHPERKHPQKWQSSDYQDESFHDTRELSSFDSSLMSTGSNSYNNYRKDSMSSGRPDKRYREKNEEHSSYKKIKKSSNKSSHVISSSSDDSS